MLSWPFSLLEQALSARPQLEPPAWVQAGPTRQGHEVQFTTILMDKEMEATIVGYIFSIYRENGEENGYNSRIGFSLYQLPG